MELLRDVPELRESPGSLHINTRSRRKTPFEGLKGPEKRRDLYLRFSLSPNVTMSRKKGGLPSREVCDNERDQGPFEEETRKSHYISLVVYLKSFQCDTVLVGVLFQMFEEMEKEERRVEKKEMDRIFSKDFRLEEVFIPGVIKLPVRNDGKSRTSGTSLKSLKEEVN